MSCWRAIDYETDHYSGRLLASSSPRATPLTIPLRREGWHAVSIGISERHWGMAAIEVRLSGDEHWQLIRAIHSQASLHEEPWIIADLTGKDLEIRFPESLARIGAEELEPTKDVQARIYSVRCIPLRAEHLPLVTGARRHRRAVYMNDGCGLFHLADGPGEQVVDGALQPFADGDFDVCCFGCGGADLVNYPSKVGTLFGEGGWDLYRAVDRKVQRNLRGTIEMGIDPMKQAIDLSHRRKQAFWMVVRPQAWAVDPPFDHAFRSRFFVAHPEYRCVEPDGRRLSKMSIGFEPVRRQLNAVMGEALERGADGICLAFNRGFPLLRYEEPVLKCWRERHGGDARETPDTDERLRTIWGEFITAWLREIRALLDDGGRRRNLAVTGGATLDWNLSYGIDVAAWAKEGLIDSVMTYPRFAEKQVERTDIAGYAAALAGTSVELLAGIGSCMDHDMTFARLRRIADAFYRAGATGICRWDTDIELARLRLDDPELQRLWCEHYLGPQQIELLSIGGMDLQSFPPMIGF